MEINPAEEAESQVTQGFEVPGRQAKVPPITEGLLPSEEESVNYHEHLVSEMVSLIIEKNKLAASLDGINPEIDKEIDLASRENPELKEHREEIRFRVRKELAWIIYKDRFENIRRLAEASGARFINSEFVGKKDSYLKKVIRRYLMDQNGEVDEKFISEKLGIDFLSERRSP